MEAVMMESDVEERMSAGDGRLQAELPGFVMVSWGHVLVAHTLHNVASLPRLCIPHGNVNHSCHRTRLRTISDA